MVVFGTLKSEEVGKILLKSEDIEECRSYAESLDRSQYYSITIDENNGKIKEWILNPREHGM